MWYLPRVAAIVSLIGLNACNSGYSIVNSKTPEQTTVATDTQLGGSENNTVFLAALPKSTPNRELLAESWDSYRRRFIQRDGRVIDYEASARPVKVKAMPCCEQYLLMTQQLLP